MTEVSLAWLLPKVTSPVVGATKFSYVDGAANAVELVLTEEVKEKKNRCLLPMTAILKN